ncbi:MAG: NTP transferase domain-containing protein [Chitinophagaceae bacterium]|nr:NTP transferase domain-containing protein [Chitinophagaceae bacterium]
MFTALKHAHTKSIFVVSCDMPFITAKAIGFVVGQSAGTQITIPVYHTKMQPLFAVYSKSCLPIWEQLIEQKFIKLQEMVAHFDLLKLNVDHNIIFDEKVLMNINDKNDLKKGLQFLKNEN